MQNRINGREGRERTRHRRGVHAGGEGEEVEGEEVRGEEVEGEDASGETRAVSGEAGGEGEPCDLSVSRLKIRLRAAGLPVSGPKATLVERLLSAGSVCDGTDVAGGMVDVGGDDGETRTPSSVRTVRRALGTPGSVRPVQWGPPSNSDDWDMDSTDSNSDSTSYEQDF